MTKTHILESSLAEIILIVLVYIETIMIPCVKYYRRLFKLKQILYYHENAYLVFAMYMVWNYFKEIVYDLYLTNIGETGFEKILFIHWVYLNVMKKMNRESKVEDTRLESTKKIKGGCRRWENKFRKFRYYFEIHYLTQREYILLIMNYLLSSYFFIFN